MTDADKHGHASAPILVLSLFLSVCPSIHQARCPVDSSWGSPSSLCLSTGFLQHFCWWNLIHKALLVWSHSLYYYTALSWSVWKVCFDPSAMLAHSPWRRKTAHMVTFIFTGSKSSPAASFKQFRGTEPSGPGQHSWHCPGGKVKAWRDLPKALQVVVCRRARNSAQEATLASGECGQS